MATNVNMVELDHLSSRYGEREILKNLSGAFSGRTLGLLGPNGAGKSSLISILLGFHAPSSGSARVLGRDIATQGGELRRLIGYMPENDAFIANQTAVSFVRMMGELSGLPSEAALERAHEALFYVGLGEARYRRLGGYSLGMRQLAKLAQAIVHGPRLLILDEPTNSLDPPARQRMLELIREMRDGGEVRIILCSHLLRDVEETCDEVVILNRGAIVHHSNLARERQANLRFLDLEPAADSPALINGLRQLGCEVTPGRQRHLRVQLAPAVAMRDVYRLAATCQTGLRRVEFQRDSLESIFLEAVQ
ncbi:MAG TPA: ABC transporter ATP-binding protein [Terriglobales bacterium]|nr:ABC transporter ATP-binding protein [Terriglobales bacterium]